MIRHIGNGNQKPRVNVCLHGVFIILVLRQEPS